MSTASTIPTAATPDVCTFAILADGTDIAGQYQVLSIAVSRELNRIPVATLHLKDGDAATASFPASNTDHFVPGTRITIQFGYRSDNETVFEGVVTRHAIRLRRQGAMLIVECKDDAVRMTQTRKSANWLRARDSDVMETLIETYGLTADVDSTDIDHDAIVQYDSSDWDFLVCRAEANGRMVMVTDGTISVRAPELAATASLSVAYGATLLELDAEIDARFQRPSLSTRAWSAADQATQDADGTEPSPPNAGNLAAADLADALPGQAECLRHGGALSSPELQVWADARLTRERLARIRGRATFQGFPGVVPGALIDLSGIGERFAGTHFVAGVRHTLAGGNWQTDVQFGLDPDSFAGRFPVSALPAGGLLPAVNGLQVGVVTALAGDPEGGERIQVRLPLVNDSDEGVWMRLATLDAGSNRGTYFRPEIDDEVVVGFIDSDPRHPVVLGQLHSSAHAAPETGADANHLKGYVSREQLRLSFDDEHKNILIETPQGNRLLLSEGDQQVVLEDQNGNTCTLSAGGVEISSQGDIVLKATRDVTIQGMNIKLSATSGLTAESSGTTEISGSSTSVKGSAQTSIKGGVVRIN